MGAKVRGLVCEGEGHAERALSEDEEQLLEEAVCVVARLHGSGGVLQLLTFAGVSSLEE